MGWNVRTRLVFLALFGLLLTVDSARADRKTDRSHPPTDERWVEFAPPARAEHVAVYDAGHRRMVVFGGQVDHAPRNDVWILSLEGRREWSRATPAGETPSPRYGAAAALDPSGERMIMFGGRDTSGTLLGDLWELSLRGRMAWRRLASHGPVPYARFQHTLTLDPEHNCLVMIGGWGTWRLSLSDYTWSEVKAVGGPGMLANHSAVFSPDLHGILVFGGKTETYGYTSNQIWLLTTGDTPTWSDRTPRGSSVPCGLEGHAAIYDAARHRMLVFGGGAFLGPCDGIQPSFWSLEIPSFKWTRLTYASPAPHARVDATAVLDTRRNRVVLYGGQGSLFGGGACNADTWELPLEADTSWRLVAPEREIPDFGVNAQAFYDKFHDRMMAYDGSIVWEYPFRRDPGWRPVAVSGAAPAARLRHAVAYDTHRNRLIVYGGINDRRARVPFTDAWALSLDDTPTWSRLPTEGGPRVQGGPAIYDPIRDRILLMPGSYNYGVWALSMRNPAAWESLTVLGHNIARRRGMSLIYDPRRDRAVLFGGTVPALLSSGSNATWALRMAPTLEWTPLDPGSFTLDTPPSMTASQNALYDPARDRMILTGSWYTIGGFNGSQVANGPDVIDPADTAVPIPPMIQTHDRSDAWAFSFASNSWSRLTSDGGPRPEWVAAAAIYDSRRSRVVVTQGDLLWALEPTRPTSHRDRGRAVADAPAHDEVNAIRSPFVFALSGASPNPAGPGSMIEFSLPDAAPATLQLFDLAGRRVWMMGLAGLGPGIHRLPLDGGRRLGAGVYLVQLSRGSQRMTRKVACVE